MHCCELYEFIKPSKGLVKKVERDENVQCVNSVSGIEKCILPRCICLPVVSQVDSIRVEHGHNLEDHVIS